MSKKVVQAVIVEHKDIGNMVKQLTFKAPEIAVQAEPGQFTHIRVADSYQPLLRRALSIADVDRNAGTITVIYRIVGVGTACLAKLPTGAFIDCLGPLGHGFNLECEHPLLVGGGMGLAPLVYLARTLCPRPMEILMGGRTRQEMFWPAIFEKLCQNIHITTDDGTLGIRGVALEALPGLLEKGNFDMIYTCGPRPMMEGTAAIAKQFRVPCQVSLEEHMACGIGGCLSCTCAANDGTRRKICSDGPVFWAGEVMP